MALTFAFYSDPGLTTPVTQLTLSQRVDGLNSPTDTVVYLGSNTLNRRLQHAASPGVSELQVSLASLVNPLNHPLSEFKLATTSLGLASAVAGAPVSIGTEVLSGSGQAKPIYIRWANTYGTVSSLTEVKLTITALESIIQ